MDNYRPWLDGTRAIAIVLVVICHLGPHSMESLGGTGVGIFFALSGYLITGLLIGEYRRTANLDLSEFYLKRLVRLMPALLLVVLVCDVYFVAIGHHDEIKSSIAAIFYVTNYATLYRGYHIPGFGHTWSLAVEEHFYLLWPPALLFMLRRYALKKIAALVVAFCVAVMLWRLTLVLVGAPMRMLYVGSLERLDSILYGAVGALLAADGLKAKRWWIWVGLVGLLPTALPSDDHFRMVWSPAILAIGTTGFLLAIETLELTTLRRVLAHPVPVRIGVLSYGIYLWHGPISEMLERAGLRGLSGTAATLLVTWAVAEVSSRFVELPLRERFRRRRRALSPAPLVQGVNV